MTINKLSEEQMEQAKQAMKAVITGINTGRSGSGYVVEIKSGTGVMYHKDEPIDGKIKVFLDNGGKMLCSPEKIKIIGFID